MNTTALKSSFKVLLILSGSLSLVALCFNYFQTKALSSRSSIFQLQQRFVDNPEVMYVTHPKPEIPIPCNCKSGNPGNQTIVYVRETYERTPDCKKIYDRSFQEFAYAQEYMVRRPREKATPKEIMSLTKNCSQFITKRNYMMEATTSEEENFPIAYVITAYTDIEYLERMLRAIYVPQNLYCIHIDLKSPKEYFDAVMSIVSCFSNVIMSSKRFDVKWGEWSQVEANLQCMRDFLTENYWGKWKYLINLTGHEYPMKTNWELVKALKSYKGNNDFSGSFLEGRKSISRFKKEYRKLPLNLTYAKGEIHGLFTQKFVKFMFEDPKAIEVSKYIQEYSKFPDEGLFQVLNFNPSLKAPGGFIGTDEQAQEHWANFWPVRYKAWAPSNSPMVHPYLGHGCRHSYDHGICCYGLEDMRYIIKYANQGPHLFLNKLRKNPYLVYDCIEEDFMERRKRSHLMKEKNFNTKLWSEKNVVKFGRGDGLL